MKTNATLAEPQIVTILRKTVDNPKTSPKDRAACLRHIDGYMKAWEKKQADEMGRKLSAVLSRAVVSHPEHAAEYRAAILRAEGR